MFKGIYYPHSDFLQAVRGARASWAWSSLLKGRELLLKGRRWQIHNGVSVHFWDDRWIPTLNNFKVSSLQPPGSGIVTVSDAIDPVTKLWKVAVLRTLVSCEELQAIRSIPVLFIDKADTLVWHHTKSGTYSVKSGYHLARKFSDHHISRQPSSSFLLPRGFWKQLWNLQIPPPKIRHFWWRSCKNVLATKANLAKRRSSWGKNGVFTDSGKETLSRIALIGWYIWKGGEEPIIALADNSMDFGTASGWTPPRVGTVKVNCDASFHRSLAKASAAAIMRDSEGHFIDGVVTSFFLASALQAEAVAVRLACRLVQMYGLSLADIENDNQDLIHLCVSETVPSWEITAIVADIRSLARDRAWKFMWTRRTNNSAAHWVATAHHRSSLPAS
ncbi:unnamed protein product [Camellia sinensis]